MNNLNSHQLYLARKNFQNVINYYKSGELQQPLAQELAEEHVGNHPGTLNYFIDAGILAPGTQPDPAKATFYWYDYT